MSMFGVMSDVPGQNSFAAVPAQRGRQYSAEGTAYSVGRLATDALFNVPLVLQNVAGGSRVRIEDAGTGALIAEGVASAGDNSYVVPYFGATRTVRAKVRKGTSGAKYLPFESLTIVGAGGGALFVSQIPDTIA